MLQLKGDFDALLERDASNGAPAQQPPPDLGLTSSSGANKPLESAESNPSFASAESSLQERSQCSAAASTAGSNGSSCQAEVTGAAPDSMQAQHSPSKGASDSDSNAEAHNSAAAEPCAKHAIGLVTAAVDAGTQVAGDADGFVERPEQNGVAHGAGPEVDTAEPTLAVLSAENSRFAVGHADEKSRGHEEESASMSAAEPQQDAQAACASGAATEQSHPRHLPRHDLPDASHAADPIALISPEGEGAAGGAGQLAELSLQDRGHPLEASSSGTAAPAAAEAGSAEEHVHPPMRGAEASAELPVSTLRMGRCFSGYLSAEEDPPLPRSCGAGADGDVTADPLRKRSEGAAAHTAAASDAHRMEENCMGSRADGDLHVSIQPAGEEMHDLSMQQRRSGSPSGGPHADDEAEEPGSPGGSSRPPSAAGFELQSLAEGQDAPQPLKAQAGEGPGSSASMSGAEAEEGASVAGTSDIGSSAGGLDGTMAKGKEEPPSGSWAAQVLVS